MTRVESTVTKEQIAGKDSKEEELDLKGTRKAKTKVKTREKEKVCTAYRKT